MVETKKSNEIAVSQEMLYHVRGELKADITTLRLETQSGFKKVNGTLDIIVSTLERMDKKYQAAMDSSDEKHKATLERFDSLDSRFDSIDDRFTSIDSRFDSIDDRFTSIDSRFDSIDDRFTSIDSRFDSIDIHFASMDLRFDFTNSHLVSIDSRMDSLEKTNVDFRAQFDSINAKLSEQNSNSHRMLTLLEEQRNENRYVLDGYASLNHRLEKLEKPL